MPPASLALAKAASVLALLCLNSTEDAVNIVVKNLKVIDAALEVNDFDRAARFLDWVDQHFADPRYAKATPPGPFRRAARAKALLLSRNPKSTAAQREQAKVLYAKKVLGTNPDPTTQADYGEILSRIPGETAAAATLLRTLRDKDLMGSAHGFEALAELEKAAGDTAAETAAREKCKLRAKSPIVCAPPPPPDRVVPQ